MEQEVKKYCTKCFTRKPMDDFHNDKSKSKSDGKAIWCKDCMKRAQKKYKLPLKETGNFYKVSLRDSEILFLGEYINSNIKNLDNTLDNYFDKVFILKDILKRFEQILNKEEHFLINK